MNERHEIFELLKTFWRQFGLRRLSIFPNKSNDTQASVSPALFVALIVLNKFLWNTQIRVVIYLIKLNDKMAQKLKTANLISCAFFSGRNSGYYARKGRMEIRMNDIEGMSPSIKMASVSTNSRKIYTVDSTFSLPNRQSNHPERESCYCSVVGI